MRMRILRRAWRHARLIVPVLLTHISYCDPWGSDGFLRERR